MNFFILIYRKFSECLRILKMIYHILMKSFIQILSAIPCFNFPAHLQPHFFKLKLLHTSIILIMVLFLVLKLTNLTAFSKYISSVYSYAAILKHSQRYKFILENPLHNTSRTKFSIILGF